MGERYNPNMENQSGADRAHISRYLLARGFIGWLDDVLDAACGTGYGTNILAEIANSVHGIDYNEEAIKTARKNCEKKNNTSFSIQKLDEKTEIPMVNSIVCLETLEHLENPGNFLVNARKYMDRFMITSVPLNEKPEDNPFHVNYFTKGLFDQMMRETDFVPYHSFMQGQHYIGIWTKS